MRPFVFRWLLISLAVAVVLKAMGTAGAGWAALIGAALFLGLMNAFVRPLVLRFQPSMVVLTAALVVLVLNATVFAGLGGSIPAYGVQPLGGALAAAGIVSAVSWPLNLLFRASDGHVHPVTYHGTAATPEREG